MNTLLRFAVCATVCAVAFEGLNMSLDESTGSSVPAQAATGPQDEDEAQRQEQLDRELAQVLAIVETKQAVIADLLAERMTLIEAAMRFRDLLAITPHTNVGIVQWSYPGDCDGERYCHYILAHVLSELRVRRGDTTERLLDLLNQLQEGIDSGLVHLAD